MYIHLGGDVVVRQKNIIGIFDLESTSLSKITKDYLAGIEKGGHVVNVSEDIPKSYVVCIVDDKTVVYLSQISTATLLKRSEYIDEISNV